MKSCRRLIPENEYNMSTISEQNSMYVRRDCLNSPVPWRTNENSKKKTSEQIIYMMTWMKRVSSICMTKTCIHLEGMIKQAMKWI